MLLYHLLRYHVVFLGKGIQSGCLRVHPGEETRVEERLQVPRRHRFHAKDRVERETKWIYDVGESERDITDDGIPNYDAKGHADGM